MNRGGIEPRVSRRNGYAKGNTISSNKSQGERKIYADLETVDLIVILDGCTPETGGAGTCGYLASATNVNGADVGRSCSSPARETGSVRTPAGQERLVSSLNLARKSDLCRGRVRCSSKLSERHQLPAWVENGTYAHTTIGRSS